MQLTLELKNADFYSTNMLLSSRRIKNVFIFTTEDKVENLTSVHGHSMTCNIDNSSYLINSSYLVTTVIYACK